MQKLTEFLLTEPEIAKTVAAIDAGGCPAVISGLSPVHRAHFAAALRARTGRSVVLLSTDDMELRHMSKDIESLSGEVSMSIPSRDFTFRDMEGVSREFEQQRIAALYTATTEDSPAFFTTTPWALMQRAIPRELLLAESETLAPGEVRSIDELCDKLARFGYVRCEQVDSRGQFARRGGILDFYSPAHEFPVRIEFYGDEIDSLAFFDASSQRRGDNCDFGIIIPAAEVLPSLAELGVDGLSARLEELMQGLKGTRGNARRERLAADISRLRDVRSLPSIDRYIELLYPFATALDYLPPDAIILISEPLRVREAAERAEKQMAEELLPLLESGAMDSSQLRFSLDTEGFFTALEQFATVMSDAFTTSQYPMTPRSLANLLTKQLPSYGGSLDTAAGDITHYCDSGYRVIITVASRERGENLMQFLADRKIRAALDFGLFEMPDEGSVSIAIGALSAGMEYPTIRLAVITEGQFSEGRETRVRKSKAKTNRERVQSFTDLSVGDLVVHEHHGIGRYAGIHQMPVDGVRKDYIKIEYSGNDALYIPATQLDMVSKYIGGGGEDSPVRLSKMGGAEWVKAKSRARGAAKDMAKELIALYAARQRARGHAFAPDSVWQTEFEERFGYAETDDQLKSIVDIKKDMERNSPMDRLLCGDVGYGKTEVALRAIMKCILDGHQAAILVPTTVLARQHFITASKRFAGYPINIEVLSRFRSPGEVRRALADISSGAADLVIGTHRLLSKDLQFKKLGLLVIDEEQRFGVAHKERLKEISKNVDVLTLSATPIPRTLNMALSGIRDMSVLEEPPTGRQPVQTYVMEHEWGVIIDAIRREVSRGGQVYYLHNRVETIDRTAAKISQMLNEGLDKTPNNNARIAVGVAHGQMDEESLEEVMERLSDDEISVLVCTTIIETGIDIPNVNTLIIEDADKMGLSQLHQIRGRVGRSPRRAYAYLTFRYGKVLSEVAAKRLGAIREFAEFNSGFKIAMRDLEIRGAGNLIGSEQSGHMMKVGYDMYLKLLEEAVLEEKGEKAKPRAECSADISVSALLPDFYVPSGEQRVDLYRRIARVRNEEDADEMIAELIDRYGDPPPEAVALVRIAQLRNEAAECGISEITQKSGKLRFKIANFDMGIISALYARTDFKGRVRVEAGQDPVISLTLRTKDTLTEAERFLSAWNEEVHVLAPQ